MKKIKVAIGMSGGVDSSVAAKILLDQGYEVVGFMMKLWSGSDTKCTRDNACCDIDGLQDAKRVAKILNIPFYVVDVREKFKKEVADYFIEEYQNLRTPNPCVKCNEKIKFGWLLDFAESVGCQYLATGHYTRIVANKKQETRNKKQTNNNLTIQQFNSSTSYHLLRGVDEQKDQSYFLYRLNQKQLAKIMFPVGQYLKTEVRAMARKWHLPVHEKKESQEICFVEEKDYREFLKKNIPASFFKSGDIVDISGNIIGKHDGLINYTIGQRKGINQNSEFRIQNTAEKQPMYVVGFDVKKNQLIVGEDKDIYKSEMTIGDLSWIDQDSGFRIKNSADLKVKIRYRHPAVGCMATRIQNTRPPCKSTRRYGQAEYRIQFDQPQRAITPGQSAVFYDGDEVLGGGVII